MREMAILCDEWVVECPKEMAKEIEDIMIAHMTYHSGLMIEKICIRLL